MTKIPDWLHKHPFAHRGLHNGSDAPENSLAAIERAVEKGHGVEIDAQLLSDGSIAVFHDDNLKRLAGKDIALCSLTEADLKDVRLTGSDEKIPLLGEVLDVIAGKVPLIVELKNETFSFGVEPIVHTMMQDYKGEYVHQSANPLSLLWHRLKKTNIPLGLISSNLRDRPDIHGLKKWIVKEMICAPLVRPDFFSYEFHSLKPALLKKFKAMDNPVLLWTIRTKEEWDFCKEQGFNAIFEDESMESHYLV